LRVILVYRALLICLILKLILLSTIIYHSYDPFGRGYHFHTGRHIEQSNWVKGALGNRYNPKMFLDEDNYFDRQRFLGFVWSNRFEIGGELSN